MLAIILSICIGGHIGYVAGYHWKSGNLHNTKYDTFVYVGYPIITILYITILKSIK